MKTAALALALFPAAARAGQIAAPAEAAIAPLSAAAPVVVLPAEMGPSLFDSLPAVEPAAAAPSDEVPAAARDASAARAAEAGYSVLFDNAATADPGVVWTALDARIATEMGIAPRPEIIAAWRARAAEAVHNDPSRSIPGILAESHARERALPAAGVARAQAALEAQALTERRFAPLHFWGVSLSEAAGALYAFFDGKIACLREGESKWHYAADGMPYVRSMQAAAGAVYALTAGGLFRADGAKWRRLLFSPKDSESLAEHAGRIYAHSGDRIVRKGPLFWSTTLRQVRQMAAIDGVVYAVTEAGLFFLKDGAWRRYEPASGGLYIEDEYRGGFRRAGDFGSPREIVKVGERWYLQASLGLFRYEAGRWAPYVLDRSDEYPVIKKIVEYSGELYAIGRPKMYEERLSHSLWTSGEYLYVLRSGRWQALAPCENAADLGVLDGELYAAFSGTFMDHGGAAIKAWRKDHWETVLSEVGPIMSLHRFGGRGFYLTEAGVWEMKRIDPRWQDAILADLERAIAEQNKRRAQLAPSSGSVITDDNGQSVFGDGP